MSNSLGPINVDFTPVVNFVNDTYKAGVDFFNTAVGNASKLEPQALENLEDILKKYQDFLKDLYEKVNVALSSVKDIYNAPAPSIDVDATMNQIASAIKKAENILNEKNLIIAKGSIEAELNVAVGGGPGAHAIIKLDISPKPYS